MNKIIEVSLYQSSVIITRKIPYDHYLNGVLIKTYSTKNRIHYFYRGNMSLPHVSQYSKIRLERVLLGITNKLVTLVEIKIL